MKEIKTNTGKLYVGCKDDALDLFKGSIQSTFDIIWNLAEELTSLAKDERKIASVVIFARIEDFNVPSNTAIFERQLGTVVRCLKNGGKVFCHCFGGKGRASIAVAAIKMALDGLTAEEALTFAKANCDGPETQSQMDFVRSLEK